MAPECKVPLQREVHALAQEAGDQVGQQVKERFSLIEAYNMTLEGATAKLMWALGQTRDPEKVRELFYRPVQFDVIR